MNDIFILPNGFRMIHGVFFFHVENPDKPPHTTLCGHYLPKRPYVTNTRNIYIVDVCLTCRNALAKRMKEADNE